MTIPRMIFQKPVEEMNEAELRMHLEDLGVSAYSFFDYALIFFMGLYVLVLGRSIYSIVKNKIGNDRLIWIISVVLFPFIGMLLYVLLNFRMVYKSNKQAV